MSKPLELTIYLRDEDGDYQHPVTQEWVPGGAVGSKRFADAELAAEWHRSVHEFQSSNDFAEMIPNPETWRDAERATEWMYLMESFSTLPHFDEPRG